MFHAFYARATRWLCVPHLERWLALVALLVTLPSLSLGLEADDYILREQVLSDGPFAAYHFQPRGPQEARTHVLAKRDSGSVTWFADDNPHMHFFRPLSSLSLWLDFAHGLPAWWMHLENGVIFAAMVWLVVALYRQLGLTGAGLGWAAAFFALDGALAVSIGWISGRNTLLAACFGLACILVHDRARRAGSPLLLALAVVCFVLALLSAELSLCTLGFLAAHAWAIDRASLPRRMIALSPYALVTVAYLAHYVIEGYGSHTVGSYRDVLGSPLSALLVLGESIPVWLATTATVPVAGFVLFFPGARVPVFIFSVIVIALLVPRIAAHLKEQAHARFFALGAVLSLIPLITVVAQDRLRFFVAFGVYGVLGPWIVNNFDASERVARRFARFIWRSHGVWLPLFFVPFMFSIGPLAGDTAATKLDEALPRASGPIAILLNLPVWTVPWYQPAMRAYHGEQGPPALALYTGAQALELQRVDDRTLELYAARSWFTTPFERINSAPRHAGDRVTLALFIAEVREVDASGAPKRVRFTFDRSLDDPSLAFWLWDRSTVKRWTPLPPASRFQLPAASVF